MAIEDDLRPGGEVIRIMELAQAALEIRGPGQLAGLLPALASVLDSAAALLYVDDWGRPGSEFFHHGFREAEGSLLKDVCAGRFAIMKSGGSVSPVSAGDSVSVDLYPLRDNEIWLGMIGLAVPGRTLPPEIIPIILKLIAGIIAHLIERSKAQTKLNHLNAYLTVSSLLAQQMSLQDLLETALYCSADVVAAEAASILLLEDDKKNFVFYKVEGPAKPVLMAAKIEADKGIAGSIIQTQKSEVINDVQSDPRFYGSVDKLSGFHTRNMIAVPLIAEEEKIGVLEVLNKSGDGDFSEEDHHLMRSISEEIAFAIRNAKVFEYVAGTYCKQRQGQPSCKGCSRPLGSWTPCLKYRKSEQFP